LEFGPVSVLLVKEFEPVRAPYSRPFDKGRAKNVQEGNYMDPLAKKNLQNSEIIIYQPSLDWLILMRPILLMGVSLLFYASIMIIYKFDPSFARMLGSKLEVVFWINVTVSVFYFVRQLLRLFSVKYCITNKRLILKKGLFSTTLTDMPLDKAESIRCSQNLFGAMFDYGNVFVSGSGGGTLCFKMVRKPFIVRRKIFRAVEKNRK
jgi:hypothetical protein